MPAAPRPPARDDVEPHDNALRWRVRSRRKGVDPQFVDLGAYDGNGRCSCRDFQVRMEPLLRAGRLPADAVEAGVLKVREWHAGPWEACICYHIYRARQELVVDLIKTLKKSGG